MGFRSLIDEYRQERHGRASRSFLLFVGRDFFWFLRQRAFGEAPVAAPVVAVVAIVDCSFGLVLMFEGLPH